MYYKNDLDVMLRRISDTDCLIVKETGITIYQVSKEELDENISQLEKTTKGEFIAKAKNTLRNIKNQIK